MTEFVFARVLSPIAWLDADFGKDRIDTFVSISIQPGRAGSSWWLPPAPDVHPSLLERAMKTAVTDAKGYARILVTEQGRTLEQANADAWQSGRKRLEAAIAENKSFAFETTLGASTIPRLLQEASRTHDVLMWFCDLSSPEQHIARVKARVAKGVHPIPEKKIRERWDGSRLNVIQLLPYLAHLQVYDNSADVRPGQPIPDPVLVLEMTHGRIVSPDPHDAEALAQTPAGRSRLSKPRSNSTRPPD